MLPSALKAGLSRQQFNSIQSFLFLVILQVLLLISFSTSAIGQNIFPVAAPWETGIGSALIGTIPNQFPQKPLHLHTFPGFTRHTFAPPLISNDPAFRISSGPNLNTNTNWGHLVLITAQNDIGDPGIGGNKYYSNVANYNPTSALGDFVLEASYKSEDLVLVTRNETGRIRFATSPTNNADVERMTIWPNGKIIINPLPNDVISPVGDFSIKLSEGLNTVQIPNISFVGDGTTRLNPEICFYRTFGGNLPAHSWRIGNEQDGAHYINLTFKSSTETVTPGGTDDINGTGTDKLKRLVEFQNNGSVVFSGPDVDPVFRNIGRPLGAGTRFYWERQKGAIRAGYATGDLWDFDNIGMYSTAFGHNTKAEGEYSIAIGENCHAYGQSSVCIGLNSRSFEQGYSFGDQCHAYGHNSTSLGHDTYATGNYSTALGNDCATGTTDEIPMWGYDGAFYIGDDNGDYTLKSDLNVVDENIYHSDNKNQITFRFMGDYYKPDLPCVRFITHRVLDQTNNILLPAGAFLYNDGNDWVLSSDSNLKKNISPVNIYDVLYNLRQVPVKTWEWKNDTITKDSSIIISDFKNRWMGPMAQDFYKNFPIGIPDSTKLCPSVMSAAMMASIQALANINDSLGQEQKTSWHKGGDSIVDGDYIGSKYCEPILMKVNGHEKVKIADGQITFKFNGNNIDTTLTNAAYRFYSNDSLTTGVYMSPGESGWRTISDRNQKEDFQNIDGAKILKSIGNIPVNTWIYKKAPLNIRYIGPMAQDIYTEFKLGGKDSLSINSIIFDGINFAGIKALIVITEDLKKKIENTITKDEFSSYRDSLTENNNKIKQELDTKLSIKDFNSFKDSMNCYKDACKIIDALKDKLNELQTRIDSLEAKHIAPPNDKNQSDAMQSFIPFNDIILEQNRPNPFSETSEISYYIPKKYDGMAKLIIANENGSEIIQKHEICNGKPCQLSISSEFLHTGVYLYGIEINGKLVKSNKMMIIK